MIQKILWLLLWMFPIEFFGQLPTSIHLEKSVGLPSNEIYDLFQDRDEFVWLATQEGLYRYDGHQYKGYQYSNQYSRAGNKIIQDTAGRIWYFSFDGYLYYVENDSLHLFNPALGNLFNYCIFKNHLFIHQKKNILIYNLNKLTLLNSISLGDRLITDISVLKDGIILENSEVPLLLDSIGNVKDLNFSLSDNLVTRYVQNGHRIFGIQKNKSDQILVEVDKEKVMPTINIFNKGVNKFYIIKDEIFILEQDKINIISKLNLLPKKKIFINERPSCIMKDKRGFFWIGTLNKGIFIIDDFYNELIPIPEMEYALSEIIDSFLFLGTTKGEVFRTDLHTLKTELIYKTTPPYQIYDFIYLPQLSKPFVNYTNYFGFKYKSGVIQVATSGLKKMALIEDKYLISASSGNLSMIDLSPKSKGENLWNNLYNEFNKDSLNKPWSSILVTNLRAKSITYIKEKNIFYVSSNIGLIVVSSKGLSHVKYKNDEIFASYIESYGIDLYVLTNGGKLLIKRGDADFIQVPFNYDFLKIKKSGDYLFLIGLKGIFFIRLKIFNQLSEIKDLNINIANDLVVDIESYNNNLIIITKNGFLRSKIIESTYKPKFLINHVNHHQWIKGEYYLFESNVKDVEINFSILDYIKPNNHLVSFSINGEAWKLCDLNTRNISLNALQPGIYEIKFKLNDKEMEEKLEFRIMRPWYLSFWFLIGLGVLISFILYYIYQRRLKLQNEKNKMLMEKIQLENNLKQSLMSSIKSQMNPHFLFNALNTIQSFIVLEDKKNASMYLSKFSKLTRMILDMSEKSEVTLSEEVSALKLYLDLEKIRFEDFEYIIKIDPNLSIESIEIPSMIIQPYVENAIKHGLLHKKGPKLLQLILRKFEENYLVIEIDDNGIGRKRSSELNQIKINKHKSFATEANKKRLEILNSENRKINIQYMDKVNSNGIPEGTFVQIMLPIIWNQTREKILKE